MATYQFSALADGQTISFNPSGDVLFFDESDISAARVFPFTEGSVLRISVPAFGSHSAKTIFLSNVSAPQLATSNTTFADGSRLLFGDNAPGTANDNAANSLVGTTGDDHLKGFGGADTLNGSTGNDLYEVSTGDVVVDSGGVDTVMSDVSWSLGAGFENLTLTGTANLSGQGTSADNRMEGNSGSNYFNGRGGNDTILGGAGNDTIDMSTGGTPQQGFDSIDGGAGIDTVDYDGYARSGVNADLFNGFVFGGGDAGEGHAQVFSIERFIGGAFNDQVGGSDAAEYLDGRGGNDTLLGRDGNDTLIGGAGNDELYFVTAPGAANADLVVGFASGSDVLMLSAPVHSGIGPNGRFSSGDARFWSSTSGTAHDASDRVIYNTGTGQLWYDADGNGSGTAQLIATLQGAPTLLATDVQVVNGMPAGATINGTAGNDSLTGTAFDDTINGLGGNDTIRGVDGSDNLNGGDGNDLLEGQGQAAQNGGNPGADLLVGGAGDDTLNGALSETQFAAFTADTLDGGLGNDVFHVDGGGDTLIDAGGVDTVVVHALPGWTLADGYENLQLFDGEGQGSMFGIGNAANNVIEATSVRHARLEGLGGNDLLVTGESSDELYGGDGNDTLRSYVGTSDDTMDGGSGDDLLEGEGEFNGGAGNDTLNGGYFNTLTGGSGADTFLFDQLSVSTNAVSDFASGVDELRFDALAMTQLGASGRMAAGDARFHSAAGATSGHDADDRLVYNTSTRELFYDADGSGAQAAERILTLQPGAVLAATDIVVINGTASSGGTINGTAGNDSLTGTSGNDTINGLAGNDTLNGLAGADSLNGGADSDVLDGGDGNDFLVGDTGNDSLFGRTGNDSLFGGAGSDELFGAEGNDLVDAGDGDDAVYVGPILAGLDESVEYGADTMFGGAGSDSLHVFLRSAAVVEIGTGSLSGGSLSGGGSITFSGFEDFGFRGEASVHFTADDHGVSVGSSNGDSTLIGGAGADTLVGGDGDDLVRGGGGVDFLHGGLGADVYLFDVAAGAANADLMLNFETGEDILRLDGAVYAAIGPSGRFTTDDARFWASTTGLAHDADDRIILNFTTGELWYDADGNGAGAAQRFAMTGDNGNGRDEVNASDIEVVNGTASGGQGINGTAGNDSLTGTAGNDTINGLAGNDTLRGLAGDDRLDGGAGVDSMDGGAGDDTYVAGTGDVLVEQAAGGTDTVESNVSWTLTDHIENLTLLAGGVTANGNNSNNVLRGNDANNSSINGRAGDDTMFGMGGNDVFDMSTGGTSSYGNDVIDGGAGTDGVEFGPNARSAVSINLTAGTASGGGDGGAGSASLVSIENALGGNFNDTITGSSGANLLRGSNGNDTLNGKAGVDVLNGGAGNDAFVFDMLGSANRDIVQDFVTGVDKLQMENSVMTAIGATGNFAAGDARFWAAAGVTSGHDANDRIVYNTTTGDLFYDADGSGAGAAQFVGNISGHPALAATDIAVI